MSDSFKGEFKLYPNGESRVHLERLKILPTDVRPDNFWKSAETSILCSYCDTRIESPHDLDSE